MLNLTALGLPMYLRDLRAEFPMAMCRAARNSTCVQDVWREVCQAAECDAAMIWLWRPLHAKTPVFSRRRAVETLRAQHPEVATLIHEGRFREARRRLQPTPEARWNTVGAVLQRRLRRWTESPAELVSAIHMFQTLRRAERAHRVTLGLVPHIFRTR